jgi:hypothetical protein
VTEPERVPRHRVHASLQAIVARGRAAAGSPRPGQQDANGDPPRLGRHRLASWPIPAASTTRRCAVQRHRQRPRAPRQQAALRAQAGARGAAGGDSGGPCDARDRATQEGVWRSVRRAARVRSTFICGRSARSAGVAGRPHWKTGVDSRSFSSLRTATVLAWALQGRDLPTRHGPGAEPLKNLGRKHCAPVQIQRNALETIRRVRGPRAGPLAQIACISP